MNMDSNSSPSRLHSRIGRRVVVTLARRVAALTIIFAASSIFALERPSQLWEIHLPSPCDSSPAVAPDGTVYFGTFSGDLWAVTPGGDKKWKFTAGNEIWSSPAIAADGTIYFGSRDRKLYALDAKGHAKWK